MLHYSQYTGIGGGQNLTSDQKKLMFKKLINDSKQLNATIQN